MRSVCAALVLVIALVCMFTGEVVGGNDIADVLEVVPDVQRVVDDEVLARELHIFNDERDLQAFYGDPSACAYEQGALSDEEIKRRIHQACPCSNNWDSRATYLHGCVEPILNNWRDTSQILGRKAKSFWYWHFKYEFFMQNNCGPIGRESECPAPYRC